MIIEQTKDAKIIAKLNESVQNIHHELYPKRFKPYHYESVLQYFNEMIDKKNHFFFICHFKGEVIGYVWFDYRTREDTAFSHSLSYIYINHISVEDAHRGKGVGKLLLNHVFEYANKNNIKRIGLDYYIRNISAKKIYKKLGFEVDKEITFYNLN